MPSVPTRRVSLATLDMLSTFWAQYKEILPYVARFRHTMHVPATYCWVFGSSKSAVVDLALEWSRWQTNCIWRPADEEEVALATGDRDFGFWEFSKLPFGIPFWNWFDELFDLTDPDLSTEKVMQIFKEKTFDAWGRGTGFPVVFMNSREMDEEVLYWQEQRAAGEEYYGSENEIIPR